MTGKQMGGKEGQRASPASPQHLGFEFLGFPSVILIPCGQRREEFIVCRGVFHSQILLVS
jgi:hypothetical protein